MITELAICQGEHHHDFGDRGLLLELFLHLALQEDRFPLTAYSRLHAIKFRVATPTIRL